MAAQIKPYGAWVSPITPELALSASVGLSSPLVSNGKLFWLEGRPTEKGRNAIMQADIGSVSGQDLIPDTAFDARTGVHEYGGASYLPLRDGSVLFSNYKDNHIYTVKAGSKPQRVCEPNKAFRYANFAQHPTKDNKVVCILEDHTIDEPADVVTSLVLLDLEKRTFDKFVSGTEFYAAPCWSPSGKYVAWVQWKHPDMPWEGSEVHVGQVSGDDLKVSNITKLAGDPRNVESVSQPRWGQGEDKLVFLSDRTGFYELYEWTPESQVRLVLEKPSGEDAGGPDWMLGQSTHQPLSDTEWICAAKGGKLRIIDLKTRKDRLVQSPFASIDDLTVVSSSQVALVATPHESPKRLSLLDIRSGSSSVSETVIKKSSQNEVEAGYVSVGQAITYPTKSAPGEAEGQVSHAIFYPPTNRDFVAPDGERPPLCVRCHGGPTSAARPGLDWNIQLFTSRGFAFVDVNYGGSTGYGKDFRRRLDSQWGIVDVQDTISAVEYLAREGKVDGKRCTIAGGSAGGFTVLAALCDSDVFGAGVSKYGVADLGLLAAHTHKFESQYLFNLVGGTPEEVPQVYHDRSPINKVGNIKSPMLLLQGTEDKVVPPEQAVMMADKIKANGGKVELVMFEGEGHGFRMAENRLKSIALELGFYRKTFGIEAETL